MEQDRQNVTGRLAGAAIRAALVMACAAPASAQTLTIGVQRETVSLDPHFSLLNPSVAAARHMFDTLAHPDERQRMRPGLAVEWAVISPTEWEYRLRPNVRFHDGTPFTAEDVAVSLKRAATLPRTVGGMASMTRQVTSIRVVDPLTIRLGTNTPFPLMTEHLSVVPIVSRAAAEVTTEEFNAGKGVIGTGPFRFVAWTRGASLQLARNDAWWGPAPAWRDVTIRLIANEGARVAALMAGSVDAIESVPPTSLGTLRERSDLHVVSATSNRVSYLVPNFQPDANPQATDASGNPLPRNPFADQRVRRAVSLAMNRQAITERVLEGQAIPAAQLLPDTFPSTSQTLRPEAQDTDKARALLADAGYPDGFNLVLYAPRDRGASDVKVSETVAQMLTRIGIRTTVDAVPYAVFQPRFNRSEFALAYRSWGTETGEGSMALRSVLGTRDPVRAWGIINGGRYSNPRVDALLTEALATMDATARGARVAQATEIAIGDLGVIPLHYDIVSWALRRAIAYPARSDNYTFAWEFRPVGN